MRAIILIVALIALVAINFAVFSAKAATQNNAWVSSGSQHDNSSSVPYGLPLPDNAVWMISRPTPLSRHRLRAYSHCRWHEDRVFFAADLNAFQQDLIHHRCK